MHLCVIQGERQSEIRDRKRERESETERGGEREREERVEHCIGIGLIRASRRFIHRQVVLCI